jgi:thioredoxin 1
MYRSTIFFLFSLQKHNVLVCYLSTGVKSPSLQCCVHNASVVTQLWRIVMYKNKFYFNLRKHNQKQKQKYNTATMVKQVANLADFQNELKNAGDKLVVVDFWATWCGPCKAIAPKYEEMSKTYTNAVFLKVDVDNNSETSEEYEVQAMPTFLLFKNNAKIGEVVGANAAKLEDAIKKNL